MKISFFTTWRTPCGIADYSKCLVEELQRYCHVDIIPVSPQVNPFYYRTLGRKMNNADITHIQYEYGLFGMINPYINNLLAFIREIKIPKVITLHSLLPSASPKPLAGPLTKKISLFMRNAAYLPFGYTWDKDLYTYFDYLIVHTRRDQERLVRCEVSPQKIFYSPIPSQKPSAFFDKEECKRRYGLSGKTTVTVFGFINDRKGYELLIEVFDQLPLNSVLLIAGGLQSNKYKSYLESIKRRAAEKGLEGRMVITGYLPEEEIPAVMAATDICVAPFIDMDASASLAMNLTYHKVVVASDLGPNKEFNEAFGCLQLFRAGDATDLLKKITSVLADSSRREHLVENTKKYNSVCNYATLARDTFALYQRMIKLGIMSL
jgi:glycosyltransferase involved in cell wall biosynthesis